MADRFRRHLSGWRIAALLPAAALALAALLAACAPESDSHDEDYDLFLERVRRGDDLTEIETDFGTKYFVELLERALFYEDFSEEKFNDLKYEYKEHFGWMARPSPLPLNAPPPLLLNDPPPPIHTSGEPYPPGTFPPEVADIWERSTDYLQIRGSTSTLMGISEGLTAEWEDYWDIRRPCITDYKPSSYLYVADQLLFTYREAPEDPQATIEAELQAAGVQYDSITVLSEEHYAEHDPKTFYNWLSLNQSKYNRFDALERLGAEWHPDLYERPTPPARPGAPFDPGYPPPENINGDPIHPWEEAQRVGGIHYYQVKLHGLDGESATLPENGREILFGEGLLVFCRTYPPLFELDLTYLLAGGLYTTFGDDVVMVIDGVTIAGQQHQRTQWLPQEGRTADRTQVEWELICSRSLPGALCFFPSTTSAVEPGREFFTITPVTPTTSTLD